MFTLNRNSTLEEVEAALENINPGMAQALYYYLAHGIMPGSFLTALLSNNLMGAVAYADGRNIRLLKDWAHFLYSSMASESHGSQEKVINYSCEVKAWKDRMSTERMISNTEI